MESIIQFVVENAVPLLGLLVFILSIALMFLRKRAKAVGNEVLIGLEVLKEGLSEDSPEGKNLSPEEERMVRAQGKRVIEEAVRHFGGPFLRKLFGIKEPEEKQVYYNK